VKPPSRPGKNDCPNRKQYQKIQREPAHFVHSSHRFRIAFLLRRRPVWFEGTSGAAISETVKSDLALALGFFNPTERRKRRAIVLKTARRGRCVCKSNGGSDLTSHFLRARERSQTIHFYRHFRRALIRIPRALS
jgi:hypothetical protein